MKHDRRFNMRDYFVPSKPQLEFLNSLAKYTMFSGSNQTSGKSTILKIKASYHLDGRYPRDEHGNLLWTGVMFDHPTTIMMGSLESIQTRDNLIVGFDSKPGLLGPAHARGTGAIPLDSLVVESIKKRAGASDDVIDKFLVRWHKWDDAQKKYVWDGSSHSTCLVFSQASGWEFSQGRTIDWIGLDEEFKQKALSELKARLISTDGYLDIAMCPLSGYTPLYEGFEKDAEHYPELSKIIYATIDNSHWLTPTAIENAKKTYVGAYDELPRLWGRPAAGEGMIYKIPDEEIVVADSSVPEDCSSIIGIDLPHTTGTFAAVKLAYHEPTDTVYLTNEFKSKLGVDGRGTYVEALRLMGGASVPIAWPHDAGRMSAGKSLAEFYRDMGLSMLPEAAYMMTLDGKKSNEILGILDEVNTRMRTGRFKVCKSCEQFLKEKGRYGSEDGLPKRNQDDHLIDAMHKAVMMLRFAANVDLEGSYYLEDGFSEEYDFFGAIN